MFMAISSKILSILFFTASIAFCEEARLHYKTNEVADIAIEVRTDFLMKIGDKDEMQAKGVEKIETEVKVLGNKPTVDSLPLHLAYKLKSYKTELSQGEDKTVFDINTASTDFLYAEIKQLKDKEAIIVLNSPEVGFEPKEAHDPLAEILRSKKVSYLLLNRLREPFFLVGQSLAKGKTIEVPVQFGEKVTQDATLKYIITHVSDNEVKADIFFSLPRQRKEGEAILVSSGELKGYGIFQRQNALNFHIELKGQFGSALKPEDNTAQSQTMNIHLKAHGSTRS